MRKKCLLFESTESVDWPVVEAWDSNERVS